MLLPQETKPAGGAGLPKRRAREDYPFIFRTPVFWILLIAMFLCNLPQIVAMSQLKMVLTDNGIDPKDTSIMLAALPFGVLVGRFVAGLALDRYPARIVGFLRACTQHRVVADRDRHQFAGGSDFLGPLHRLFNRRLSGGILAFVVSRKFGLGIYSSVMGLMTMAISFAVSFGAALLSMTF